MLTGQVGNEGFVFQAVEGYNLKLRFYFLFCEFSSRVPNYACQDGQENNEGKAKRASRHITLQSEAAALNARDMMR